MYFIFGAMQQTFFLIIFTNAILQITNNHLVSMILGTLFYFVFHLRKNSELRPILIYVLIFGLIMNIIYLYLNNILPQMVLHGIFGAIGYTLITDNNIIEKSIY